MKLLAIVEGDEGLRGAERAVQDDPSQLGPYLQGLLRAGKVSLTDIQLLALFGIPGVAEFLESMGEVPLEYSPHSIDAIVSVLSTIHPQAVRLVVARDMVQRGVPESVIKGLAAITRNFSGQAPPQATASTVISQTPRQLEGRSIHSGIAILLGRFLPIQVITYFQLPWNLRPPVQQIRQAFLSTLLEFGFLPRELARLVS